MITFVNGNIFEDQSEAWVNCVNCVGKMGAGLAKQFSIQYPQMITDYQDYCNNNLLSPGGLHVWTTGDLIPKYIINFATKNHWNNPSQLEWIVAGLANLNQKIQELNIVSIALPGLGCNIGKLDWDDVKAEILNAYNANWQSIQVTVYQPKNCYPTF